MGGSMQCSILQMDLIRMLRKLNIKHSLKGVIVRNYYGSQFIANKVLVFLRLSETIPCLRWQRMWSFIITNGYSSYWVIKRLSIS